ncbi:hypothetical protein HanPSC8_Chr07g0304411 [Helianthus annuus]|nr:hypothetical protein HanPSC8_Chr07g0304411 [Helianthus annuus]
MPFALSSLPLQNTTPHTATILSSVATTRRHTAARRSHFSLHTQPLLSLRQSHQVRLNFKPYKSSIWHS